MKRPLITLLLCLSIPLVGMPQVEQAPGTRPFYSLYLHKKLNQRFSVDAFTLVGMRSTKQDFWLAQYQLGVNYRLNRLYSVSVGFGQSMYPYRNASWWERHYPELEPNSLNAATFNTLNFRVKRDDWIGRSLKLSNRVIVQHYFPKFEKYQTRLQLNTRLGYRRANLPLALKPFVQGAVFYYLNGVETDFYDEELEYDFTAPPDGWHRYRVRIGTSFRPIKDYRKLSLVVYYALNREFNLEALGGGQLNTPRPSQVSDRVFTNNPFNNYNIFGVQVNYFL
ncbi:MAG: hypothetical protein ACFB10_11750 [Salibacteraceae bacterium]